MKDYPRGGRGGRGGGGDQLSQGQRIKGDSAAIRDECLELRIKST